jgi:beta-lactamase regulating signal transducer with metallopeptidase domain
LTSTPEPTLPKPRDWKLIVASIWAAGLVVCLTRLALNALRLSRKLRRMPVLADAELLSALRGAAATLGVRRLPEVRLAPDDCPPALVGALRPRLLLSRAVLASLSPAALRLVLLHELEHLKRRDVLANWLLAVIAAAHWFNPLLWLCFRRMRADRELACDEQVLRVSAADAAAAGGAGRERYGQTIVDVLHVLSSRAGRSPAVTAAGVLDGKNFLRRRITMIARLERSTAGGTPRRRVSVLGCAASVLLGAVALTGAVRGQDTPANKEATSPPPLVGPTGLPGAGGGADEHDGTAAPSGQPTVPGINPGGASNITSPPIGQPAVPGTLGLRPGGAVNSSAAPDGQPTPAGIPSGARGGASSSTAGQPEMAGAPSAGVVQADAADDRHVIASLEADIQVAHAKLDAAKISAEYKSAEAARVREQVKAATVSNSEAERVIAEAAIAATQIEVAKAELKRAEAELAASAQRRSNADRQRKRNLEVSERERNRNDERARNGGFGGGFGGPPPAPTPASAAPATGGVTRRVEDGTTRGADVRAWQQLNNPLSVQFDGVQLTDVLDQISKEAGITIFVDWQRIEAANVSRDSAVTVHLREPLPADQVLELVLRSAGGEQLGFTVDRGIVVIDTLDGIRRTIITRAYDVGDLRKVEEDVATAVRESVRPDTWRQPPNPWGAGATGGTIRMFGDQLIVSADEPTHREVEKLLGLLRAGADTAGGRIRKSDAGGADAAASRTQAAASALARTSKDRWVFVPQTAAKAVEWISRESGVPIRLDAEALKAIGVDPSARIEFIMGASDPVSALKTVLTQATSDAAARSRSFDTLDVGAIIVDGVLQVSTVSKVSEQYGEKPDAYWILGMHSEQAAAHDHGEAPHAVGADDRTKAVLSALKRQPTSGAWRLDGTMRSAVERIAREAGVSIRLDDDALTKIGIDPGARIELDLAPTSFAQVLSAVAKEAGKDATGNLGGVIADGEIRISVFDASAATAAGDPKPFWCFVVAGGRH